MRTIVLSTLSFFESIASVILSPWLGGRVVGFGVRQTKVPAWLCYLTAVTWGKSLHFSEPQLPHP